MKPVKRFEVKGKPAKREHAKRFNGQAKRTKVPNQAPREVMRGGIRF